MFGLALSPLLGHFAACTKAPFLGIIQPWYQYLTLKPDATGNCSIANLNALGGHSSFLLIALAIVDDLIRVAALVAVGFVIYGGIQYTTSVGSPEDTTRARTTIINALIGLVLAILAASIVTFIGNRLAG